MREDFLLLNPGPVPVSHAVTQAMDTPVISRRSAAFTELFESVRSSFRELLATSTVDGGRVSATGEPLVFNGTGTMALEAGISNVVDPDDEVVAIVNGVFGDRMAEIAKRYASVTVVETPWGTPIEQSVIEDAVSDETALVTLVHNETSTGLANAVAPVGEIAAAHDALFLVDGISSIGGMDFRFDEWDVDIAVTDPQKALGAPPGISLMLASPEAQAAIDGSRGAFYLDLETHLEAADRGQTPYTCASPQVRALAVALEQIDAEGMPARIARHNRFAEAVRAGMTAMGLELFPAPNEMGAYSATLTAVSVPEDVDLEAFDAELAGRGVSVGGGLGPLAGELFRFGNMGALSDDQIIRGVYAVGHALCSGGYDADIQAGLDATERVIR